MWKDKIKEIIYMLENSDINEIEVRFWFKKIKVTKKPPIFRWYYLYCYLVADAQNKPPSEKIDYKDYKNLLRYQHNI